MEKYSWEIPKTAGTLTNYAFAFFIGYASVCFSWARNLDSVKDQHKYFEISFAAEMFVYTSIIFLFSSAFSYFHKLLDEMPNKDKSLMTLTEIVQNISMIAFGSAYCVALSMMFKIIALFGYPWTKNQKKIDELWMRHLRNIKDEEKVDEIERIEALKLKRKNALVISENLEVAKKTNKEQASKEA